MSACEDLLLVGNHDGESCLSGDETNTDDFLSDDLRSATQSPTQGRSSPGILSRWKHKLGVGMASKRDYQVYHWRWFMLATMCLLNLSNGTVGISS